MTAIPGINLGALKISFPINLPRNDKDLICMLLAGRLKDLWNGKLICAQLALMDLIKDLGVSKDPNILALKSSLMGLSGSLNSFKQASGYNQILSGINRALGQVTNVFSLGGLCPTGIRAPQIPDILGQLNLNLFGQANGILNALAQASNPKVCFGGGPKGFGIDWSQVKGDLKNLKLLIKDMVKNPGNYGDVINSFRSNFQGQTKQLLAEIRRIEKDLSDPLGISDRYSTVSNISRTKNISDGFKVKDRNGIEYQGPAALLLTGEINSVFNRTDPLFVEPVRYQVVPVLDYCGDVVGFEKKILTGDPNYMGWDTINTDLNYSTPTELPAAKLSEYKYTFVEEADSIHIYDETEQLVNDLEIERGKHYRIAFRLKNRSIRFYQPDGVIWDAGIKAVKEPDYGIDFESVVPELSPDRLDSTRAFKFDFSTVEIDWSVQIEHPTTPNLLYWRTDNNIQGNIIVAGPTVLDPKDRSYDVSMAAKKAWAFIKHTETPIPDSLEVIRIEEQYNQRIYRMTTELPMRLFDSNSSVIYTLSNQVIKYVDAVDSWNANTFANSYWSPSGGYKVMTDNETVNPDALSIESGNKVVVMWCDISEINPSLPLATKYLVLKKYINDISGLEINGVTAFITSNLKNQEEGFILLGSLTFDEPLTFLNDTKLPYTDQCDFKLTLPNNGKLNNNEEFQVEIPDLVNKPNLMRIHLSANRENSTVPNNEYVYTSDIELDPTDTKRTYLGTNPTYNREVRTFAQFQATAGLYSKIKIALEGTEIIPGTIVGNPDSYNEIITAPGTVESYDVFDVIISGGAPNSRVTWEVFGRPKVVFAAPAPEALAPSPSGYNEQISGPASGFVGVPVIITITGGSPGSTVTWSGPATGTATLNEMGEGSFFDVVFNQPGIYTYKFNFLATGNERTYSIAINPDPATTATFSGEGYLDVFGRGGFRNLNFAEFDLPGNENYRWVFTFHLTDTVKHTREKVITVKAPAVRWTTIAEKTTLLKGNTSTLRIISGGVNADWTIEFSEPGLSTETASGTTGPNYFPGDTRRGSLITIVADNLGTFTGDKKISALIKDQRDNVVKRVEFTILEINQISANG